MIARESESVYVRRRDSEVVNRMRESGTEREREREREAQPFSGRQGGQESVRGSERENGV